LRDCLPINVAIYQRRRAASKVRHEFEIEVVEECPLDDRSRTANEKSVGAIVDVVVQEEAPVGLQQAMKLEGKGAVLRFESETILPDDHQRALVLLGVGSILSDFALFF